MNAVRGEPGAARADRRGFNSMKNTRGKTFRQCGTVLLTCVCDGKKDGGGSRESSG